MIAVKCLTVLLPPDKLTNLLRLIQHMPRDRIRHATWSHTTCHAIAYDMRDRIQDVTWSHTTCHVIAYDMSRDHTSHAIQILPHTQVIVTIFLESRNKVQTKSSFLNAYIIFSSIGRYFERRLQRNWRHRCRINKHIVSFPDCRSSWKCAGFVLLAADDSIKKPRPNGLLLMMRLVCRQAARQEERRHVITSRRRRRQHIYI